MCVSHFMKWWEACSASVQFSSVVQSCLAMTLWIATCQASLSITNSRSLLKFMSIESVMTSNHLILCCPLLRLPSTFPRIRVFSNESALLHIFFLFLDKCLFKSFALIRYWLVLDDTFKLLNQSTLTLALCTPSYVIH